jgi:3-oxoadipate enol-lactonase
MSDAFYEINAGRLYCQTDGAGVPVVLLHGFGLDLRMWEEQSQALAEDYFVIRYDIRGYGRSTLPTGEPYSHADDLHELLSRLGAVPAHVVGLSNGGRLAIRFALAYPKDIRSLTLVDSALDGHAWSADWLSLWAAIDGKARSGNLAAARRLWLEHPLFAPAREHAQIAAHLSEMVQDYSGWHWVHTDPGVAPGPPAIRRLKELRAPTLIVVGEKDLPDFHQVADTLASGIAGADCVQIPGVGHMANMEAPGDFNRLLADFLASRSGTT